MNDHDLLTRFNDDDLFARIRDSFADGHMSTPLDAVLARGRALRRRRRLPVLALAAFVAVAAASVALISAGKGGTPISLAAWTVDRQSSGTIEVAISQLRDPAGLQRALNADGVAATVRFNNQSPPDCADYPGTRSQIFQLLDRIITNPNSGQGNVAFDIDPAAIPQGAGLWIEVTPPATTSSSAGMSSGSFGLSYMVVYANGRCPVS
jgi:hypothetical protein